MKNENMTSLGSVLAEMSTEQLDRMLHEELQRDPPDGDAVRLILRVLEEREKNLPRESTPEIEKAWKKYRANTKRDSAVKKYGWILKVASIAVILGALVWMVPQTAQATGIFDRIARWTDSFFELLSSDQEDSSSEYVFETDNPALQQVYDAVVELGVTEPVVPMWLPGDYELKNKQVINEFDIINWGVELIDGEKSAIYQIIIYSQNVPSGYCKDNMVLEVCEIDGIEYNIIRND